jgi:uncharacterized protein with FMN-binding domain
MLLLFNPNTGLVAAVTDNVALAQSTTTAPPTTTGQPLHTTISTTTAPPTSVAVAAPTTSSVLGASVPTEFGPIQVEIVIEDGQMVEVVTVAEPEDRKSQRINDQVMPLYEEAVISTQSADIDAISGATVTWGAYTASVQSAMDEAGI